MLFYISGCLSELRNRRADGFWVNCTDKCQRYTNMHRNLSLLAHTHKSLFLFFFVFTFLLLYVLTYKRIMSSFVCQLNSDVLLYTNSDSWENLISHLIAPSPLTAGYILSKWVLCSLLFLIYYPQVLYKLSHSALQWVCSLLLTFQKLPWTDSKFSNTVFLNTVTGTWVKRE